MERLLQKMQETQHHSFSLFKVRACECCQGSEVIDGLVNVCCQFIMHATHAWFKLGKNSKNLVFTVFSGFESSCESKFYMGSLV